MPSKLKSSQALSELGSKHTWSVSVRLAAGTVKSTDAPNGASGAPRVYVKWSPAVAGGRLSVKMPVPRVVSAALAPPPAVWPSVRAALSAARRLASVEFKRKKPLVV